MYANSLIEVGKLIYLVGNYGETALLKKILQSSDGKSRIFYKCVEDLPANTLKKIKYDNVREGIIRADWLNKIVDRYPEMVVFLFNLDDDSLDIEKIEGLLREILKKINKFVIDTLKVNAKEDIIQRYLVKITKQQSGNSLITDKINYYLKTYEKDLFVIQADSFAKEVSKYRTTWLSFMEKNYERKMRKLQKQIDESISIDKRICYSFKTAILSEILSRDEKLHYANLYNAIKFKFGDITKKQFNFLKYLQIRELRIMADTTFLRQIKYKILSNVKQLPEAITMHMNIFKMRNMQPTSCHFYFYFEQLLWRSTFLENLLEVLYSTDIMELLPHVRLAEYVNGLLSYLHRVSMVNEQYLEGVDGKVIELPQEIYLGKYNYGEVTDGDMVVTGTCGMIGHRKDYISKGIQVITRYKTSGLFKINEINFLNIYLIRFYLADGKFSSIIYVYNEILKVEVNRCNYFLINQLFKEIKGEMENIDNASKILLYGVASLICDYFESKSELNNYMQLFFGLLGNHEEPEVEERSLSLRKEGSFDLFANELAPQAHVFKLKKSSSIFSARIIINDQIILSESQYRIKINFSLNEHMRARLGVGKNRIQLHFNQQNSNNQRNMICEMLLNITEADGELIEREIVIEPLNYIRRDTVLKIDEVHLIMANKNLVWVLEREQIVFAKYDSTLFFCKMEEPEILIEAVRKVYYINETAYFYITVRGVEGCKITSEFTVNEDDDGKTEFFMNARSKKDLTNSGVLQELAVSGDFGERNLCWIKVNKSGNKTLKLSFKTLVQKSISVHWREKALNLKVNYNSNKEVSFNVASLFTVGKVFREALTGSLFDNNIPINKKTLLCFYIKASEEIEIKELGHHNNPRKIKYLKNIKMGSFRLAPLENLKVNILFEVNEDCQNQFQLFLTTLFIKWTRVDNQIPVDNIFLDEETKINATNQKAEITFEQKHEIVKRKKSQLYVKVQNLTANQINICATMQSTENILRVGQKSKRLSLKSFERCEVNFDVLCIHSGIYDFPPVKVAINEVDCKVSTSNFLVNCA